MLKGGPHHPEAWSSVWCSVFCTVWPLPAFSALSLGSLRPSWRSAGSSHSELAAPPSPPRSQCWLVSAWSTPSPLPLPASLTPVAAHVPAALGFPCFCALPSPCHHTGRITDFTCSVMSSQQACMLLRGRGRGS